MASHYTKREHLVSDMRNGLEHRWGTRVRVGIPVAIEAAELPRPSAGYVKNVSLSGALLNCEHDLRLHSLIEVSIDLPASSCTGIVTAHISRKCNEGVGIAWCDFAPKLIKDLLRSPPDFSPR
jgi:PilZ domain